MTEREIKKLIKDEFDKLIEDRLDKEVKKVMRKSNSATRDELINTIKDSLEAVYKILWVKRDFWKTDIK